MSKRQIGDLSGIRLLILDVDGVLTDGSIIINSDGSESKKFTSLASSSSKLPFTVRPRRNTSRYRPCCMSRVSTFTGRSNALVGGMSVWFCLSQIVSPRSSVKRTRYSALRGIRARFRSFSLTVAVSPGSKMNSSRPASSPSKRSRRRKSGLSSRSYPRT